MNVDIKNPQRPSWLCILFLLCATLSIGALYEMLWAWVFANNCCSVSVWYDMPNTVALTLALTTVLLARRVVKDRAVWGLWLLVGIFLLSIPFKKYLSEHQGSGLLAWYALLPVLYLGSVILLAFTSKRVTTFSIYILWGVILALATAGLILHNSLLLGNWWIWCELSLLVFQFWLLFSYIKGDVKDE